MKSQSKSNKPKLPPLVPRESEDLQRAICLLGNRTKGELGAKPRAELTDLVGKYPNTVEEAAEWKAALRQVAKDRES
jgi:hypothetical protein